MRGPILTTGLAVLVACAAPAATSTTDAPDESGRDVEQLDHGDPPCAFDETGCLPAELVVAIEAESGGPLAYLIADAPVEWTRWQQQGVPSRLEWKGADGSHSISRPGTGLSLPEAEAVASHVDLRLEGNADLVNAEIAEQQEATGQVGDFQSLELHESKMRLDLDPGVYVLRVRAWWPQGDAEFLFTFRRA